MGGIDDTGWYGLRSLICWATRSSVDQEEAYIVDPLPEHERAVETDAHRQPAVAVERDPQLARGRQAPRGRTPGVRPSGARA